MPTPAPKSLTQTDESRGIQNATSRFTEQQKGRLLQSELLGESGRGKGEAANDPDYREAKKRRPNRTQGESAFFENELAKLSQEEDFQYEKGDAGKFIANPPDKPVFPVTMLLMGVLKDIIDLSDFTGVGVLVTTVISFLVAIVLFIYFLGKMNGIQRWLWKRWVFATIISLTPVLKGVFPETTILIFLAYHHENKIVSGITKALEEMYRLEKTAVRGARR